MGPVIKDRRLALLVALAAAARLAAWALRPSLHPDAYFQYLEPAWLHLHGYGWPPWEMAAGLRSWVLPGYHGTLFALFDWLGVHQGAAQVRLLQLHWALLSVLVVPAAFRAGGLWAALAAALLPELLFYAPQTLTEVPAAILAAWGCALWLEGRGLDGPAERRKLAWAAALLSFCVCLRLPNAPLLVVPVMDLSLRRRWPALGAAALAAVPPLLCFGGLDWLTWGRPFHAMHAFLDYSFLQGRAAEHGTSPWYDYFATNAAGFGCAALLALCALGRSWPAFSGAALLVILLSTQPHKEERFLLAAWPLLAMAVGLAVERWRSRAAALGAVLLLLAANGADLWRRPPKDFTGRAGLLDAEAWVGQRPDATGLLVEGRFHLSGGFAWLGKNLPLETFHPALLQNPIFNYAAVPDGSSEEEWCKRFGLKRAWSARGFSVWNR